jgi:hypothetical protein
VHDDLVVVETGLVGDRLARVFGRAGELEGLGPVEGGGFADFGGFGGVDLRDVSMS